MSHPSEEPAIVLEAEAQPSRPPLWERLLSRRVPQILGIYLGAATSAVLFTDFLVGRYGLSPYLPDILLAALLIALPAVAVLAYAHGAPGPQRWSRRQVGALIANGILGVGVVAIAFWGKPLGATTQTVTIETADGDTVERTVARAAFRRRVVVADLEGDDALGRAAGYALAADLDQDLFVSAYDAGALRREVRQGGFETLKGAPAALIREAAATGQFDRLVTGRVERTARGVRVEVEVYDLEGGGRPATHVLEGPDLGRVLDELSENVRADLDLPEILVAEDQLIEDHLSGSTDALVAWGSAGHAVKFLDDAEAAVADLRRAVALDSTFARANRSLGATLFDLGREDEARAAFTAAQRHRYRLPEPDRFALDSAVATLEQRPDDAVAIVRDWAALFPDDVRALETLTSLLLTRDDSDGAIEVVQQLVALDSGNPIRLYQLATLYLRDERIAESVETSRAYIAAVPDDAAGPSLLAGALHLEGDLDGAVEASRKASRLAPSDLRYTLVLGAYQVMRGDWAEAERLFRRVATTALEPKDRASAQSQLAHLYDIRGQYQAATNALDQQWEIMAATSPAIEVLRRQIGEGYHYTRAGQTAAFEDALARADATPELQSGAHYGSIAANAAWAYAQIGQSDEVLRYSAIADSVYQAYGYEAGLPYVHAIRGMGYANRQDYARAIRDMASHAAESPTDHYRVLPLAQAYLASGDTENAQQTAETILRGHPSHPGAHLVMAKITARRQPDVARRHIEAALDAWAEADDGVLEVAEARALLRRLSS